MAEKIVKDSQCLVNDLANDCISRQAAIDAIRKGYPDVINSDYKDGLRIGTDRAIYHVEQLSSAQPEWKKGKWVGYDGDWLKTMCKCSECGAMIDVNEKYRNFFCYHCGARMDGEQDG